jgi:cellulose synthase operon protein C
VASLLSWGMAAGAAAQLAACSASRQAQVEAPGDAPAARLAQAERTAAAHPNDSLQQARAGFLRYLVASDPAGALALFDRAQEAAKGKERDEGAALAQAGRSEVAKDRLETLAAARGWAAALRRTPRAGELPVAELCARRLLEVQGDSAAIDDVVRAAAAWADQAARDGAGLPGRAARLLREAAARIEGERATDALGLAREAERWREVGAVRHVRLAGPYAALRLGDLGRILPLDTATPSLAPATGPMGPIAERALDFPDGDIGLDGEPAAGDLFYAASEVTLAAGGDYLATVEGAAALELRLDGSVVLARSPWPREMPRAQSAAVSLSRGAHALLVRFSRAEGQEFRVALTRADGAPSDATTAAPARVSGARTSAPCGLGKSCVQRPAFPDDGGLRGYAERALASDGGEPFAAWLLARATLADDKPAARAAVERLIAATGASAAALMERQSLVRGDNEVPERIGRSRALADLALAVGKDPGLLRARLATASLQRDSERYAEAGQELDRAVAGHAEVPVQIVLSRARLVEAQGNAARALALAREALAREERCDARMLVFELTRREGGQAEARKLAESLQGCPGGRAVLASLLRESGDLSGAERLLALAAAARPSQAGRLEQLADVLLARKEIAGAVKALRAAAALSPRSPGPLRRLAGVLDAAGDNQGADAVRLQALALAPGDLQLRHQLATSRGESLLPWSQRDGLALARRPSRPPRPGEAQPSAELLLDYGSVQVFADGGAVERVHSVARVLNKRGIARFGEVQVPGDAEVLELRTIKADGRVLEPEAIPGKEGISMPGLEPGDAVEVDYLRGFAPRGPELPGFTLDPFFFRDEEIRLGDSTYEVRAPDSLDLQVDAHNLGAPPRLLHAQGETRFSWSAQDVRPTPSEPSAPSEAETTPWVQAGAGSGEAQLFASMADWVLLRARPSHALDALARAASGATPREQAARIHAAIAQAVRGRSTGSDFSATAAQVLAQGRGNRLLPLKAALASAGIPSHLALVRPFGADPAPYRFPRADLFTSAVLRVDLPEGPTWVDSSLRLAPFGQLPPWARGQPAWILPEPGEEPAQVLTPGGQAAPIGPAARAVAEGPTAALAGGGLDAREGRTLAFELELSTDGSAEGTGRDEHRGFDAASLKDTLERLDQEERKQAVESMLGRALRGVALDRLTTEGEGASGGNATLVYALHGGLARKDGAALHLPASIFPARLRRRWAQKAERKLPLLIDQPESSEVLSSLALPAGMHLRAAPAPITIEVPFGRYTWEAREEAGKLRVHETLFLPQQRIAPALYGGFASFARAVDEAQERELRIAP